MALKIKLHEGESTYKDDIERMVIDSAKELYDAVDDEEARDAVIHEWGEEFGLRGYAPFTYGYMIDPSLEYIAKIDDLDVYPDDLKAAEQAEKDGIRLIPYSEQPKKGFYQYYRFLDTPNNRKILQNISQGESKNEDAPWEPTVKKIKDLKKGEWFTLKPIEEPKESQVWELQGYDKSDRVYWAIRWSNINDCREFKGDKEVYTGFTF